MKTLVKLFSFVIFLSMTTKAHALDFGWLKEGTGSYNYGEPESKKPSTDSAKKHKVSTPLKFDWLKEAMGSFEYSQSANKNTSADIAKEREAPFSLDNLDWLKETKGSSK